MTSFFSWVDFDTAQRDQMRRAIALFQDNEARDELGRGTIRDAFSELFFPGTSTIMTRLRYFLFLPWIYRELEERRTQDVTRKARHRHTIRLAGRQRGLHTAPSHHASVSREQLGRRG